MDVTHGRGANIVLELAGYGELVPEGIRMLGAQGTFVEIGNIVPGRPTTFEPRLLGGEQAHDVLVDVPPGVGAAHAGLHRHQSRDGCRSRRSSRTSSSSADIDQAFASSEWDGKTIPVVRSAIVP